MRWSRAMRWSPCMTGCSSSEQSLMPVVNALLLGSLLYKSRLVPRVLPLVGLIGAPLLLASDAATLFGVIDRTSALSALLALPIALWEFSLGVWLTVKGFKPSPITAGMGARPRGRERLSALRKAGSGVGQASAKSPPMPVSFSDGRRTELRAQTARLAPGSGCMLLCRWGFDRGVANPLKS